MKAIIIGGFPQFIGHVVDAYPFDPPQKEDRTLVPLYSTDPPKFVDGVICKFQEPHLAILPPEDECEDPNAVLITMYDHAV